MATIHNTTMTPGKLDLLAAWLPGQPWYRGTAKPALTRAGGFRLDDPDGQVGIEFMAVTDSAGAGATSYLVPLTYRGSPLEAATAGLIGTAEHGVLGRRWVYDGMCDPVLVAQLIALIQGGTAAQAQTVSDTPDPTVSSSPITDRALVPLTSAVCASNQDGTELRVTTVDPDGAAAGVVTLVVSRVLRDTPPTVGQPGAVTAGWQQPDGGAARSLIVSASYASAPVPQS